MSDNDRPVKIQAREALDGFPQARTHGATEHRAGHSASVGRIEAFTMEARRIRMEVEPPHSVSEKIQAREALGGAPQARTHGTAEHRVGHEDNLETTEPFTKEARRIRMELQPPHQFKQQGS